MERDPWWKNVDGPFPEWPGPVGVKPDGGGCHRASGTVGKMVVHRAVHNHDADAVRAALAAGYEGWLEGAELLLGLGAKIDASNNAGDRPWHWAHNLGHTAMLALLEKHGATREFGKVLVADHTPKVKDFFQRECWAHHPKPYADFMRWRADEDARWAAESGRLIPGG